jgi:hypothetical protein
LVLKCNVNVIFTETGSRSAYILSLSWNVHTMWQQSEFCMVLHFAAASGGFKIGSQVLWRDDTVTQIANKIADIAGPIQKHSDTLLLNSGLNELYTLTALCSCTVHIYRCHPETHQFGVTIMNRAKSHLKIHSSVHGIQSPHRQSSERPHYFITSFRRVIQ